MFSGYGSTILTLSTAKENEKKKLEDDMIFKDIEAFKMVGVLGTGSNGLEPNPGQDHTVYCVHG